jgi:hypothetical protein
MVRILLMISLAAASLAAKDRAWQTGQLLDNALNPYFKTVSGNGGSAKSAEDRVVGDYAVQVNVHASSGDVLHDDYVIEGEDTVYLVETTRFKSSKAPHLSLSRPLSFAVEKNKLWIKDLDRDEFEAQILKQAQKGGSKPDTVLAAVEAKPAPEKPPAKQDAAPPKTAASKEPARTTEPGSVPLSGGSDGSGGRAGAGRASAEPARTTEPAGPVRASTKPEPMAAALVRQKPDPAVSKPAAKPAAPAPKPDPKVDSKADPKLEASVTNSGTKPITPAAKVADVDPKRVQKPEPAAKPESGATVRAPTKDRAWQSGQLLSVVNNSYFFNVTYSSDADGSGWPFAQGSDGRYTVKGQVGNPTSSLYTYDNYVIESQFCVYLVQRMRPKTSMPVRLPGTRALKFATEKNKLWVLGEDDKEYETKVVKLIQKDAIIDPSTRAAAR